MNQDGLTTEFSICLPLDRQAAQAIIAIRQTLPASPYRDDTPHITLLRTIKSALPMSDRDLLQDMERLLELSKNLPLTATVQKPADRFSPLFRWSSSLVLLRPSAEMKAYRKNIIRILKANNYSVGLERLLFLPHISIRLGVPYTKHAKVTTKQSFRPESKLTFNTWIILRDIKKDGKYLVKEIAITAGLSR